MKLFSVDLEMDSCVANFVIGSFLEASFIVEIVCNLRSAGLTHLSRDMQYLECRPMVASCLNLGFVISKKGTQIDQELEASYEMIALRWMVKI